MLLVLAGLAGCSTTGLQAADTQPINVNVGNQQTGIWVSGQGKVTVTPDIATINLGVSVQKTSVAEAQAEAAQAMDDLMAVLKNKGIAEKDIQTQYFNIYQVTRWDEKGQQEVVIGYRVSNTVSAKIRDIDKAGEIIDAVAAAAGDYTRIDGIGFSVDNPEQYYDEAREAAMNDAKAKAEQLAELADVTLGKVTYIAESSSTPYVPYRESGIKWDSAMGAAPTTSISAGEMDIILNVQVAYEIK